MTEKEFDLNSWQFLVCVKWASVHINSTGLHSRMKTCCVSFSINAHLWTSVTLTVQDKQRTVLIILWNASNISLQSPAPIERRIAYWQACSVACVYNHVVHPSPRTKEYHTQGFYSAQAKGRGPSPNFFFPSVSQIGTPETLIGSRALYSNHVFLLLRSLFSVELLMANCTREVMVLALPGRSVPPHVDSDKLRNELHS